MTLAPRKAHVWEKVEIALRARKPYANPYRDVEVWVDLRGPGLQSGTGGAGRKQPGLQSGTGLRRAQSSRGAGRKQPGFEKRCQGFWDGDDVFRVRVVATAPGTWTWKSGSNRDDAGLVGLTGEFEALEWTEAEKRDNPCRRGFIRATPNGHALEHADGTPFFLLGDTWWATPTYRVPWYEADDRRPVGPDMGFKDMVRFREAQGFNCIAIIACFPAWASLSAARLSSPKSGQAGDGRPAHLVDERGVCLRSAWRVADRPEVCKDMHNEGGRPFLFPGRVPGYEDLWPDVDRINPAYFRHLDRKIDYLSSRGFVSFIETARRDVGQAWKAYYDWPGSYVRLVRYVFARYQAAGCILSPIHFDSEGGTIPASEWNEAANLYVDTYGPPPFDNLVSCNAAGSSMLNFGHTDRARWLTLHQIGNKREHVHYGKLTDIFNARPAIPCLNGEPYYDGWGHQRGAEPAGTETSALYCRSGMYGSVLSGGLAGHIYGSEGLWGGDIEEGARNRTWEALGFRSGDQMRHLRTFVMSQGARYRDLVPRVELVSPNRFGEETGYTGWAYCSRTDDRRFFLVYFEKGCPPATVSGALPGAGYGAKWFDPRKGEWLDAGPGGLRADEAGRIALPPFPHSAADSAADWGLELVHADSEG